jgi:hypothetical protein
MIKNISNKIFKALDSSSHYMFWTGMFVANGLYDLSEGRYLWSTISFAMAILNIAMVYTYKRK